MKIGILYIVVGQYNWHYLSYSEKNKISHLKPPMFNPNSVQNLF